MGATVELNVMEKIIKILSADTVITAYTEKRIYSSHISSIAKPVYPAISIFLIGGAPHPIVDEMAQATFQIDLWFASNSNQVDDVMKCAARVRALLHRQSMVDAAVGVSIKLMLETAGGPLLYEQDVGLYHLPIRYLVVAV